nr:FecR domain-containing protein [Comamonas koreensis]
MAAAGTGADSPRKRLEYALLLIARQHAGEAASAKAATQTLARWRAQSPDNEAAAQQALQGWQATEAHALQADFALPTSQAERSRQQRRRSLSLLGTAGLASLLGLGGRWYWQQPLARMALHTGHSQMLAQNLPDGSHLDLAPSTFVEVVLYRDRRVLQLARGEIRLDVVHDAQRPLEVQTPLGRVRVLGTVFSVALRASGLQVSVAQGRVAVWGLHSDAAQAADVVLAAGEAARLDAQGGLHTGSVNRQDVGAWRDGWLVFDHTPLPEVLSRWNDYLERPLQLDPAGALQSLHLTGSFQLRDPATFVASLPRSLPVRVERLPDGSSLVRRR